MEDFRIRDLETASRDWDTFYECSQIKNRGDEDSLSESMAAWLIRHCEKGLFLDESIRSYVRTTYDKSKEHRKQLAKFLSTNKHKPEHNIEYALFMHSRGDSCEALNVPIGDLGIILDHQVPLLAKKSKAVIDLLSYSSDRNCLYILELKEPQSNESLLKCVLEAYTYYRRIGDIARFKASFNVPSTANIVIAPLVFMASPQFKSYEMLKTTAHEQLRLFRMIDEDMKARMGDERCKVAFAVINRTAAFSPKDSLADVSVAVSPLDAIQPD